MDYSKDVQLACQKILDNCTDCGVCVAECELLQAINEDLTALAARQPSVEEAYSCTLCGLCEGVCPSSLSPRDMFATTRKKAVKDKAIPIEEFRYMFPDRQLNVMKMYREVHGIDYQDLKVDQAGEVAFFPGCTLMTYDPQLVYLIIEKLESKYQGISLLTQCCGIPLYQLGLQDRAEKFTEALQEKFKEWQVKTLIFACSNCYYQLKNVANELGIEAITVYEALEDSQLFNTPTEKKDGNTITIHDSCPDRFEGIFAEQTRKALIKKGYSLVEMEHNRLRAVCCGSGGQASHFAPELAQSLVQARLEEVEGVKADILSSYCLGCVLNLNKEQDQIPVQHVLNLLLDFEQDFAGLKKRSKTMFEGPEGEKIWARIMDDD